MCYTFSAHETNNNKNNIHIHIRICNHIPHIIHIAVAIAPFAHLRHSPCLCSIYTDSPDLCSSNTCAKDCSTSALHAARIFNSIRVGIALLILLSVKSTSFYTVLFRNQNARWTCMLLTCCIMYTFRPYFASRSYICLFSFFQFHLLVSTIRVPCATNKKFKRTLLFSFTFWMSLFIMHGSDEKERQQHERNIKGSKHRESFWMREASNENKNQVKSILYKIRSLDYRVSLPQSFKDTHWWREASNKKTHEHLI